MSFPTIYRSLITSSRVKTTNCIFFTTVFFTPPQSSPVQSSPAEHGTDCRSRKHRIVSVVAIAAHIREKILSLERNHLFL